MKFVFAVIAACVSSFSFAADLVGIWNVKMVDESYSKLELNVFNSFLFVNPLCKADKIEFKADGSFFCNDSVYGTYSFNGDELLLRRAPAVLKKFERKLASLGCGESDLESIMKFAACDTTVLSFSKSGNRALVEKKNMFGSALTNAYFIDKQGADAQNESVELGKSIIGNWYCDALLGVMEYSFKPNGVLSTIVTLSASGFTEKDSYKYTFKDNYLKIYSGSKVSEEGQVYFGRKCLYFVKKGDMGLTFWKK